MPALDRNLPVKCAKCKKGLLNITWPGTKNLVIVGLYHVPNVLIFFTKRKGDLNYHLAKHHAPKDIKLSTVCTVFGRVPKLLFSPTTQE